MSSGYEPPSPACQAFERLRPRVTPRLRKGTRIAPVRYRLLALAIRLGDPGTGIGAGVGAGVGACVGAEVAAGHWRLLTHPAARAALTALSVSTAIRTATTRAASSADSG
jgi:hypothetical protein